MTTRRSARGIRSRHRLLAALAAVVVLAAGLAGGTGAAQAATETGCSTADPGSGRFATTLCWFDLSSYDSAQARSAAGQEMEVRLPGGSRMSFTLKTSGGMVQTVPFPTWSGAYLGNREYTGVSGRPALYQTGHRTTTDLTLSDIRVVNAFGQEMTAFSLVGADAESTDANESITWRSSNPITSLTANGSDPGVGTACDGRLPGLGTTEVSCAATRTVNKTGNAIVASENPDFWSQRMVGGGVQAVAFGVLLSQIELNKAVESRFTGDDFRISIGGEDGTWVFGASTGPDGTSATTGRQTVIARGMETRFTFSERMIAGELTNYDASWSCTRNGAADPTLPTGRSPGYRAEVHVGIGDLVSCTITNAKKDTGLSLVKRVAAIEDVNGNGITDAGDRIRYTFRVTNTGELPLTDVRIDDPKLGSVSCPPGELAPDASVDCAADAPYTVTPEDEQAGVVENRASAAGTVSGTSDDVSSRPARTRTPAEAAAPALSITKAASPSAAEDFVVGQQITYTFVVTNTGNVPIDDVTISEDAFSGSGELSEIQCPADRTVQPDDTMTCTATYTITQADVDSGSLSNTASASGMPAGEEEPVAADPVEEELPSDPSPEIGLEKRASPRTVARAGEIVTYTFHVTNTGNVTLNDAEITEVSFSGTGGPLEISCPPGPILPGDSVDCTASYEVTQADVDAGRIDNTATAAASPPPGQARPGSGESSAVVAIPAETGLALEKSAEPAAFGEVGQLVEYRFVVTNTGNVTVSGIAVDELEFSGSGELSAIECPGTALGGGESMTCTASYVVTQADLDRGELSNAASASGTAVGDTEPIETPRSDADIEAAQDPALELVKSVEPVEARIGDTVLYRFTVTNTGNVSVVDPWIDETGFTGTGTLSDVSCPEIVLAPGESATCTASYTVGPDDGAAGTVRNTAVASAYPPSGAAIPRSNVSDASLLVHAPPVVPTPSLPAVPTAPPAGAAPSELPRTGIELGSGILLVVLLLISVGARSILVARRRRTSD
ncbi:CshA/CshB family fibrillar adhesin-related protein [Agromyces mediolanus]|uniref:CshA/CshB family fibrillar adhesin-related protein n=1 Tax=Agromyces mediolanus TaxID=41986 RepID=UPI001E36268A|nr:CshA/CshB family fibrillar adhesin-related protein [Agromyces mediolanus]MCD1573177.1 hypothetical protein [Agromyces mediolanus]